MTEDAIMSLANALQVMDPTDTAQVAEADARAGAMLQIAMTFIQNRLGQDGAARHVGEAFEQVAQALKDRPSEHGAGSAVPALHPGPRRSPPSSVQGRAETLLDVLSQWAPADADREARAAIWGSAAFLHRHLGEEKTAEYLRFILARMSLVAWFEQLPVASLAKH